MFSVGFTRDERRRCWRLFFTVARQTVEVVVEKYAYTPQEGGCASERFFPDKSW